MKLVGALQLMAEAAYEEARLGSRCLRVRAERRFAALAEAEHQLEKVDKGRGIGRGIEEWAWRYGNIASAICASICYVHWMGPRVIHLQSVVKYNIRRSGSASG